MELTFNDEQRELRQMVRGLVTRETGRDLWKKLSVELGLTGITVPEVHGGAGASTVELGIVLAELGRALTAVPFLQTTVAATILAGSSAPVASEVLGPIAAGQLIAGLATPGGAPPVATRVEGGLLLDGTLDNVVDGPALDLLLTPVNVEGTVVLAAIRADAAGIVATALPTLDQTRPQGRFTLDGALATQVGDADATARAIDLLLTAVAVESVGAARFCLETSVEYLKTRVQFGRPIGTFQALQHRCADLAVLVEAASSTAWYAVWAAGAAGQEREASLTAPLAKAYCADAFRKVASEMIQLHGGIGFTWEHPAHRYLKRATSTHLLFGGREWVRALAAQRAGLGLPR